MPIYMNEKISMTVESDDGNLRNSVTDIFYKKNSRATKGKEVSLSSTSTSQPSDPLNQTIESSSGKASTRKNDDTQFAREFGLAVNLDWDIVMRYFDGNRYMTEFIEKYQSMDKTYMYKLSDGSYLEERLFKFGLTCTYEHLCHSFIFDPNDVTYIQKKVLTEEQIQELNTDNFNIKHSEQWYQSRIWLPLELLFERINDSKSLRGESASASSSERKNLHCVKRRKKVARYLHGIAIRWRTPEHFLKAFFDICDFRLGFVARITRSSEYQIPSNISELSNLLPMLSMMLVFRLIIMTNIHIITEAAPESDVRSSFKKKTSPKREDDFVRAAKKKKVNAATREDAANSRFKSVFKQGQDKKLIQSHL
ncbi:hypothetical protein EDC94DRAFT_585622 [Helicostylum pulchrum]|nr:hypothetical protein EDC94DRAFT_585622 [Helicostylum pulchrum]